VPPGEPHAKPDDDENDLSYQPDISQSLNNA